MALTIANAQYGRSASGIANLKAEFASDYKNAANILKGAPYTTLLKVIKANWVGADADAYVAKLTAQIDEIVATINSQTAKIETALDTEISSFRSFQERNK